MANGSLSSNSGGEGEIRRAIIEADLVDCIVAMPPAVVPDDGNPGVSVVSSPGTSPGDPHPSPLPGGEGVREEVRLEVREEGEMGVIIGEGFSSRVSWRGRGSCVRGRRGREALFWEMVRDRRFMELKFRRQHQVGDYIADFYCHEHRMVVELDGGVHSKRQKKDRKRDAWMTTRGFRVLRFRNEQLLENPEEVLREIASAISEVEERKRGTAGADFAIGPGRRCLLTRGRWGRCRRGCCECSAGRMPRETRRRRAISGRSRGRTMRGGGRKVRGNTRTWRGSANQRALRRLKSTGTY